MCSSNEQQPNPALQPTCLAFGAAFPHNAARCSARLSLIVRPQETAVTDPVSLIAGLSSLAKIVGDIAATSDAAKRNALLIEFQRALIDAQSVTATEQVKNAQLVARNQELEAECTRLKAWSAEAERYTLTEISRGVFAYVELGGKEKMQSTVKLCTNCFERREKSVLQQAHEDVGRKRSLTCNRCKAKVIFHSYRDEEAA